MSQPKKTITDVCVLVEDVERSVAFYTDVMGFRLRRKAEGFADFEAKNVILAAWELDHISRHTGVSNLRAPEGALKGCIAMNLDKPEDIDAMYADLSAKGVKFQGPPEDYEWNARCAYFTDPDGMLWELYAWLEGGPDSWHETYQ